MLRTLGIIILTVIALSLLFSGGFEIIVGLIGGIIGLIAGLFGIVIGLIGGLIGLLAGLFSIVLVIGIPLLIIGVVISAVCGVFS
ncbi:MAG: hypothetical protein R3F48_01755 [Candidatus Zixiibacteriota bacterium]